MRFNLFVAKRLFNDKGGVRNVSRPAIRIATAGVAIGGLVRQGEGMHVNGMTQIQEGDSVVVFCQNMFIKKLDKYFV